MARMDRLFGVTMAEQGVSQLVSVDLKKAEADGGLSQPSDKPHQDSMGAPAFA
jgi:hypothetical protein